MAKKKNPHIGRSLDEFIVEQRAKDPEFRGEFDRRRGRLAHPAAFSPLRSQRSFGPSQGGQEGPRALCRDSPAVH